MGIYVPIVMYGLRLYVVIQELHCLLHVCMIRVRVAFTSSSFLTLHLLVSEIAKCIGLRLFIVVLQELHCLLNCLHVCMIRVIGFYHITKFCYSIPYGF